MAGVDSIEIQVLADGTLKVITDKVSMPNHGNAEMLIGNIVKEMGGSVQRMRRIGVTVKVHDKVSHSHGPGGEHSHG